MSNRDPLQMLRVVIVKTAQRRFKKDLGDIGEATHKFGSAISGLGEKGQNILKKTTEEIEQAHKEVMAWLNDAGIQEGKGMDSPIIDHEILANDYPETLEPYIRQVVEDIRRLLLSHEAELKY